MNRLLGLAESLFLEKLLTGNFPVSQKSKTGAILLVAAAALGATAAGFLITAFCIWVGTQVPPASAALTTGGLILALALCTAGGALAVLHRRANARAPVPGLGAMGNDMIDTVQLAVSMIDDELGEKVRENPLTALLLASLTGYVVGDRIRH
ncbi:MAG: hypothetical protein H6865_04440 [Rhodospirillales bacterium]|nr:hypothetical protein [Alphaproteobacteria bacterium]MCB9986867.1 hypothetical protein [Rhodospirillales bacterium]USO08372.1 MAG: hypothetical protein H6866_03940 [Rhodospirillales bacterium]